MSHVLYTFAEAQAEVKARLGGRSDIDSSITKYLDSAQFALAKSQIELPLLEQTLTFPAVSGQSEYSTNTIAQDLSEAVGIRLIRNDTDGFLMQKFLWQEYRAIGTQGSGSPIRWARRGNMLAFDPEPDDTYDILVDYRRRPQLGIVEIDSEWHESLIKIALFHAWSGLDEGEKAKTTFGQLPAFLQVELQRPMSQDEWEDLWDEEHGLRPDERMLR